MREYSTSVEGEWVRRGGDRAGQGQDRTERKYVSMKYIVCIIIIAIVVLALVCVLYESSLATAYIQPDIHIHILVFITIHTYTTTTLIPIADTSLATNSDTSRPPGLSPSSLPAPPPSSADHASATCMPQVGRFAQIDTTHTTAQSKL